MSVYMYAYEVQCEEECVNCFHPTESKFLGRDNKKLLYCVVLYCIALYCIVAALLKTSTCVVLHCIVLY